MDPRETSRPHSSRRARTQARRAYGRSPHHAVALGRLGLMETWALEITPGLLERGVEIEAGLSAPLFFPESPASSWALLQRDRVSWIARDDVRASSRVRRSAATSTPGSSARCSSRCRGYGRAAWAGPSSTPLTRARSSSRRASRSSRGWSSGRRHSSRRTQACSTRRGRPHGERTPSHDRGVRWDLRISARQHSVTSNSSPATSVPPSNYSARSASSEARRPFVRRPVIHGWTRSRSSSGSASSTPRRSTSIATGSCRRIGFTGARKVGAARAEGLLHAARGDKDAALRALHRARSMPRSRRSTAWSAAGRCSRSASVQRQAQQRRASRGTLERGGLRYSSSLGRNAVGGEGARELGADQRPGRAASDELTEAERQVARARRRGPQEQGDRRRMFVTVGTVEGAPVARVPQAGVRSRRRAGRPLLQRAGMTPANDRGVSDCRRRQDAA